MPGSTEAMAFTDSCKQMECLGGMMLHCWFVGMGLGWDCLMTPSLRKDIRVMCDHAVTKLEKHHIRHQATH